VREEIFLSRSDTTLAQMMSETLDLHRPQWTSRSTQRVWPTCPGVWGREYMRKCWLSGRASGQRKARCGHHNDQLRTVLDSNPKE